MPVSPTVVRVIVQAGHGLGNATPNVYDEGASSPFGTEAYIVSRVADQVVDSYYLLHDDSCSSKHEISVIPTPQCSISCAALHRGRNHLSYTIEWINDNAIRIGNRYGDVVLSLHMNEGPLSARGVEVIYGINAPEKRREQAEEIGRAVAAKLGIPFRRALPDRDTPRHHDGIVHDTDPPAFLIELGFVTNPDDVRAVETCGKDAVQAAIDVVRSFK